jgi:GNAT superfamily N-acetyltransferase
MVRVNNLIEIKEIQKEDVPQLTVVMTRAFDDDAQKHLGEERGGPDGYDDGEFFRQWLFSYQESVGYKIEQGNQIIGGLIVWILPEGHNILGTIFIDPAHQDLGIGQKVWADIEQLYPETKSWRLATPIWAIKNHHFYQKCGFVEVESDPLIPPEEGITIYYKGKHDLTG